MAMAGAVTLSQFSVCGSISLPKRVPRRRVSIRAMSETETSSSSSSVSTQQQQPTSDASSSSLTFTPPPNFKPPEPKRFAIRPDKTSDMFGALLPLLFRFATGVFVSGYSFSLVSKDEIPPDQYALEISGYTVKETSKVGPRPEKPIEIYEFESCPFCRKVREIVAILDLDVLFYPCPRNGPNFRPKVVQMGGKQQFPYMVDPNTGVSMYESDDIIRYLVQKYGDGNVPVPLSLGFLTTLTAGLAMLGRIGKGTTYTPAKLPSKPLKLWAYEGSPFCKLVREVLVELELPHLLCSCARGSPKRHILYQRTGHFQAPFLEDPNTGIEMFESAEIIEYLTATYALQ
ncbi:uncharacterized protein LOC113870985 isoform X1 [Abrus precatorius]|uniref:Uncharacterized protein LOC113870985 isoform X1 n=1 Tax=Abrus precatorius TaxID=3816 RepID=A0A8B8M4H6_ABRPR|nr:uncharacterized protein LOC113870985 isoform X1 [Abrus precatorius]